MDRKRAAVIGSGFGGLALAIRVQAAGFRTDFILTSKPSLAIGSTFSVKIDGIEVPATNANGGQNWTYDGPTNQLRLNPSVAPKHGQKLVVEYHVGCS